MNEAIGIVLVFGIGMFMGALFAPTSERKQPVKEPEPVRTALTPLLPEQLADADAIDYSTAPRQSFADAAERVAYDLIEIGRAADRPYVDRMEKGIALEARLRAHTLAQVAGWIRRAEKLINPSAMAITAYRPMPSDQWRSRLRDQAERDAIVAGLAAGFIAPSPVPPGDPAA